MHSFSRFKENDFSYSWNDLGRILLEFVCYGVKEERPNPKNTCKGNNASNVDDLYIPVPNNENMALIEIVPSDQVACILYSNRQSKRRDAFFLSNRAGVPPRLVMSMTETKSNLIDR